MSNNSQSHDCDTPLPCSRNRTQIMPIELVPAAAPLGVTQVIPVGHESTSKNSPEPDSPLQLSRGKTLILSLPNAQCPQVSPHASEASPPDASTTTDGDSDARGGPITRIARPSEWLPTTALAAIASTQEHSSADGPIPSVQTAICDAPHGEAHAGYASRFRAFMRFSSLSPRHRISLALAPLALVAAVYVLYPQRAARPTTERHTPAAQRLATETPPTTIQPDQPPSSAPAPPSSADPSKIRSQRTLLREAADSVAEGNYVRARMLYAQLQTSDPKNPAYGAALRIIDRYLAKSR